MHRSNSQVEKDCGRNQNCIFERVMSTKWWNSKSQPSFPYRNTYLTIKYRPKYLFKMPGIQLKNCNTSHKQTPSRAILNWERRVISLYLYKPFPQVRAAQCLEIPHQPYMFPTEEGESRTCIQGPQPFGAPPDGPVRIFLSQVLILDVWEKLKAKERRRWLARKKQNREKREINYTKRVFF